MTRKIDPRSSSHQVTGARKVCVIQCRLGSRRFPRKAIARLHGRPLIAHVVERVRKVPSLDSVVVAVPTNDLDLIKVLRDLNVGIVLGPEHNVLRRFWLAAVAEQADIIMRVTGDCPMWSPEAGEGVLRSYLDDPTRREFWSNDTTQSGWPDGTDTEVFSRQLLTRARFARSTITKSDCEHVTTWMKREVEERAGIYERVTDDTSKLKLSVDTKDDLRRLEKMPRMKVVDRYGRNAWR